MNRAYPIVFQVLRDEVAADPGLQAFQTLHEELHGASDVLDGLAGGLVLAAVRLADVLRVVVGVSRDGFWMMRQLPTFDRNGVFVYDGALVGGLERVVARGVVYSHRRQRGEVAAAVVVRGIPAHRVRVAPVSADRPFAAVLFEALVAEQSPALRSEGVAAAGLSVVRQVREERRQTRVVVFFVRFFLDEDPCFLRGVVHGQVAGFGVELRVCFELLEDALAVLSGGLSVLLEVLLLVVLEELVCILFGVGVVYVRPRRVDAGSGRVQQFAAVSSLFVVFAPKNRSLRKLRFVSEALSGFRGFGFCACLALFEKVVNAEPETDQPANQEEKARNHQIVFFSGDPVQRDGAGGREEKQGLRFVVGFEGAGETHPVNYYRLSSTLIPRRRGLF